MPFNVFFVKTSVSALGSGSNTFLNTDLPKVALDSPPEFWQFQFTDRTSEFKAPHYVHLCKNLGPTVVCIPGFENHSIRVILFIIHNNS